MSDNHNSNDMYFTGGLRSWKLPCEQFETVATIILRIPGYFVLNCWWEFDILNSVPRSMAWADVVSSGFAVFGKLGICCLW